MPEEARLISSIDFKGTIFEGVLSTVYLWLLMRHQFNEKSYYQIYGYSWFYSHLAVWSRVVPRHPKPRGTPSPAPKLGDGVGTGGAFQNLRGRGKVKFWGFFGDKTPKIADFRVGDGDNNFGVLGYTSGIGAIQIFGGIRVIFGDSPRNPRNYSLP